MRLTVVYSLGFSSVGLGKTCRSERLVSIVALPARIPILTLILGSRSEHSVTVSTDLTNSTAYYMCDDTYSYEHINRLVDNTEVLNCT